jgi:hypothetical protein
VHGALYTRPESVAGPGKECTVLGRNYEYGAATNLYEAGTWCRSYLIYGAGAVTASMRCRSCIQPIHVAGTVYSTACMYIYTVPELCIQPEHADGAVIS